MMRYTVIFISLFVTLRAWAEPFDVVDHHINHAIERGYFPGAQLIIGNGDEIIYSRSYGYQDYFMQREVSDSTIYDLASCSKVLATTLAVMRLYERGEIALNNRIDRLLVEHCAKPYSEVRLRELLRHDSGFAPVIPVAEMLNQRGEFDSLFTSRVDSLVEVAYNPSQRGNHIYSDINFYLVGRIVERVTGMTLREYVKSIYDEMGVKNLDYKPLEWYPKEYIAPTEYDPIIRRDTICGEVHDEFAHVLGGVSGSAGLFSSAENVAEVCAMFLRSGVDYRGHRVLKSSTVDRFSRAKVFRTGGIYALGFNKINPKNSPYQANSYGHTGFTGTYLWIDPKGDKFVILLTNRVNPTRENRQLGAEFRTHMWELIGSCLED